MSVDPLCVCVLCVDFSDDHTISPKDMEIHNLNPLIKNLC